MTNIETRKALENLWYFLTDEQGALVTQKFGNAIAEAARILGKKCVMEPTNHGMLYVKELEP
jgi:hypothetical protein